MNDLERAKMLKREAGNLHSNLVKAHLASVRSGALDNRLLALTNQAMRRYRRRSEAEADIRWPNRRS